MYNLTAPKSSTDIYWQTKVYLRMRKLYKHVNHKQLATLKSLI